MDFSPPVHRRALMQLHKGRSTLFGSLNDGDAGAPILRVDRDSLFFENCHETGKYSDKACDGHDEWNPPGPFFKVSALRGMDKLAQNRPCLSIQIVLLTVFGVCPRGLVLWDLNVVLGGLVKKAIR